MNSARNIDDHASDLLSAARAFQETAGEPGSRETAERTLGRLEDALQVLSAGWYLVAADAVPRIAERQRGAAPTATPTCSRDGLSREQEIHLISTLHEVAAAFARCARTCRDARPTVAELVERRVVSEASSRPFPRFERYQRPTGRAA